MLSVEDWRRPLSEEGFAELRRAGRAYEGGESAGKTSGRERELARRSANELGGPVDRGEL